MYQLSGLTTSFLKGRRRLANKEAKSSTTTIKCVSVSKNGRVTLGPLKKTSELVLAPLLRQKKLVFLCVLSLTILIELYWPGLSGWLFFYFWYEIKKAYNLPLKKVFYLWLVYEIPLPRLKLQLLSDFLSFQMKQIYIIKNAMVYMWTKRIGSPSIYNLKKVVVLAPLTAFRL